MGVMLFNKSGRMTGDNLRAEIAKSKWFHVIDFGDGIKTPGYCPEARLKSQAEIVFSEPVKGRSFLDIGCWDGYFSIEAYKRGAKRVLATDYYIWHGGWGNRASFELARSQLAPSMEVKEIDIMDLSPETVGTFDTVLFSGVLYHMRHPFLAMEKAASVTKDMLIVETHMNALDEARPAMIMYPGTEYNNDPTNWWGPNRPCVEAMLRDQGFQWIKFTQHPELKDRGIFHARRSVA
jgi:tRNA (mo5U34)-methyltransferase